MTEDDVLTATDQLGGEQRARRWIFFHPSRRWRACKSLHSVLKSALVTLDVGNLNLVLFFPGNE